MADETIGDVGLFGNPIVENLTKGVLGDAYVAPPFSVLNAREGNWQQRKRRWLELGIQSELGRGGNLLSLSDGCEEYRQRAGNYASPGGSPRPACDYSKGERGDGAGKPMRKHTASLQGGLVFGLTMDPYAEEHGRGPKSANDTPMLVGEDPGEKEISAANSGTSIFDPVLCELMYRWFCPPGGQILDPFAGGSVRGIVAAVCGRRYFGCDLSANQIRANYAQAHDILWKNSKPALRVLPGYQHTVIDDSFLPGGTKQRALVPYLADLTDVDEVAYAGPREGFAQLAIAVACQIVGKRCVLFVPKALGLHHRTELARAAGAEIVEVEAGRLSVLKFRATEWAKADTKHRRLLPFGLKDPALMFLMSEAARALKLKAVKEFYVAAGSGTLARAIRAAYAGVPIHAVRVGADPELDKTFHVLNAPERFPQPALHPPDYDACDNYDAKIWQFAKQRTGGYIWNVAGNSPSLFWANGDSADMMAIAPEADMIFSCPPYGDLEQYSDDPKDLSNMTASEFAEAYTDIINRTCGRLREDRFAVFVVGDYRDKNGTYRNFPGLTIRAFQRAGLKYYNECVLLTAVGSLPVRARKQFDNSRKLGKTHQNVLVFVKGDPVRAAKAIRGE